MTLAEKYVTMFGGKNRGVVSGKPASFQIGADDLDQLGCAPRASRIAICIGIHDVIADVIFHDLGAQTVDCTAQGSDKHQYVRTADFGLKRPLDSFDLPFDATDAAISLDLFLIVCAMAHIGWGVILRQPGREAGA